jgi:hypothetical protein
LVVSARFQRLGRRLKSLLAELGLSEGTEEELLLRREIDASGKSRAFANDRPVNLSTLGRLGELLVFSHGQSEQQLLLRPAEQRNLLDSFGGLDPLVGKVEASFTQWQERLAERDALALSEQERAQRLDLYRFQKHELDEANVRPEEETELDTLLPQLKNGDKLEIGGLGSPWISARSRIVGHGFGSESSARGGPVADPGRALVRGVRSVKRGCRPFGRGRPTVWTRSRPGSRRIPPDWKRSFPVWMCWAN